MTAKPSIKRALLSVSNKEGLAVLASELHRLGIEILATGGTAALLEKNNIPVIKIADVTGFPEIMNGRVKTLHPKIHGGLLGRRGIDDATMKEHDITPIDLLVVNLYPFQQTIAKPGTSLEDAIEQIDIGGPTMLRAAAKNHRDVTVIIDPSDYPRILEEIQNQGQTSPETRHQMATKAFAHTATYDTAIAEYLKDEPPTDTKNLSLNKKTELRYGENPHQSATLYTLGTAPNTLAEAKQQQGKPLSFNNLMDSEAALSCVRALDANTPGCVIVKHATPCGVAQASSLEEAYLKALATDPTSAFGGIIAFNQTLNASTAKTILEKQFAEVILAPDFEPEALALLSKKTALRALACGPASQASDSKTFHSISGGLLIQDADQQIDDPSTFTIASKRKPSPQEMADLLFAWQVVRSVKSNAIVYAKDQQTLGIGTGQTSRVFSAKIAILKAEEAGLSLKSAVVASDAFFPFSDGIEVAAAAGITAVIQPGGSKRDPEVIETADRLGLAMVMTGTRHFRH